MKHEGCYNNSHLAQSSRWLWLIIIIFALMAFMMVVVNYEESDASDVGDQFWDERGRLKYEITLSGASVIGCSDGLKKADIPTSVKHDGHAFSVVSIGDRAFAGCESLTSVVIPDSVTRIGNSSFTWCYSLTSVVIPDSVTAIGDYAFSGCTSLNKFSGDYGGIVDGTMIVSGSTLVSCAAGSKVKSVTIPDSVTAIGSKAFDMCYSLTSVSIPDSVTYIGFSAFYGCTSLIFVTMSDSVTFMGDVAFHACTLPSTLTIPDSATYIGKGAFGRVKFYDFDGITELPANAGSLKGWSYVNTDGKMVRVLSASGLILSFLQSDPLAVSVVGYTGNPIDVIIPSEVEFNGASFPVVSVSDKAFYGCGSIRSVDLGSVSNVGMKAFANCPSLQRVDAGDSLKAIGAYAFFKSLSIESVEIPAGLESLGTKAFSQPFKDVDGTSLSGCEALRGYRYDSDGDSLVRVYEEVLEIGDSFVLSSLRYAVVSLDPLEASVVGYDKAVADVLIPDEVEFKGAVLAVVSVSDKAFYGCGSIRSVNPGSVSSIGMKAFANCPSLQRVDAGDFLKAIGAYAFYKCSSTASVEIPASLEFLGTKAFSLPFKDSDGSILTGCEAIRGYRYVSDGSSLVRVYDEAPEVGESFVLSGLKYAVVSLEPFEASVVGHGKVAADVSIPGKAEFKGVAFAVVSVSDKAFYGCDSIRSVDLGSVSAVGMKAFANCPVLERVDAGDALRTIGSYAFYGCPSLEEVDLGVSLESIGAYAFFKSPSIASVDIPSSLESLGTKAFSLPFKDFDGTVLSGCEAVRGYLYISDGKSFVRFSDVEEGSEIWIGDLKYRVVGSPASELSLIGYAEGIKDAAIPGQAAYGGYVLDVTVIEEGAFYGCASLVSVIIPDSVTFIGSHAFEYCSSLASVEIPGSVTSIEDYTFLWCASLASVAIPSSVIYIGDCAFEGCSSLASVVIPSSVTSIGDEAFAESSLTSLSIPDSVTHIGVAAFSECYSLALVDMSDSVTYIGEWAFSECMSLESINISDSVTFVGSNAFYRITFLDAYGDVIYPDAENLAGHVFEGSEGVLTIVP